jgi:hypothetical protein
MIEAAKEKYWERVVKGALPDDCWGWSGYINPKTGYGQLTPSRGVTITAHRCSFEIENGEISQGILVRHTCDNRPCSNPKHLVAGTKADNSADMVSRGRSMKGLKNPSQRLTEDDVREIRRRVEAGDSGRKIAADYHVHQTHISMIARRATWSHI